MAISSEYWAWDDPRLGGDTNKYGGPWDQVLKAAGFKGGPIDPITASMTNDRSGVYKAYLSGETMNENGGWDPRYELGYSPEAISAIDKFRASGYDLRIKNPDKRTFNTYWGFVTPEGVEDIKIAGSDLGEGLRAMTPFIALMAGPLGAQLGATVGGALGVTSAVGQQAIGSALVKAGLTAAQGGEFDDVLRSGATGLLSPYVPSVVKDVVPGSLGPLESAAEKAISSGVMSAISGQGDPGAAALGSLAGSAFGAVPGASSLPPGLVQGALELASTGQLSLPTAFNAAVGASQAYEAQKTQDPNIRAELDSILGTPSDSGTLVAGPMDFSAPDRTAQKAQVADYIREQAASGARGFKVGPGGVLEVLDFDRGRIHRFTSDGSALGSLNAVWASAGSTPSAVKDFLATPYVQSLFQGGTGAGGVAGNYLVPEVTGEGAAGGGQEAGSTYTDQIARELEEELAAEELMQFNPPVTLPVDEPVTLPTDVGTSGDYGQSVFDEIDRTLAEDRRQREAQELQRQENERLEFESQRQQEILREQERQDQAAARQEEERRVLREQAERDEALRAQQEVQRQEEEQARFEEQRAQEAARQDVQRQEAEREQARIAEEQQAAERQQAEAARLADEQAAAQAQGSEQRVDQGVPPVDVAQADQGQAQEAVQAPVQQPAGVDIEQVRQIVSEALLVNPSLTEQQVLNIVTGVMDNLPAGLTSQDVADVVDAAIGRLPQGPTTADIDSAVNRAMADVATKSDLSDYATSQDVSQLGQNLQGQVQNLNQDLQYAISDAIASGLQGDAALQAGLDTLAQNLGTTRDQLLASVGTSEKALRTEFGDRLGGVSDQIGDVQNLLLDKIAAAQSVGLQGDEALRAGLDSLAADLGMTQSSLLAQLGTTEQALRSDFASELGGVQTQVTQLGSNLYDAIEEARISGLQGDAALQAALDALADNFGVTKSEFLSQLGRTEDSLRSELGIQLGGVQTQVTQLGDDLRGAINQARADGLQGDAALQKGLDTLAGELGTTKDALLAQLGQTTESLQSQFRTELGGLEAGLTEQIGGLRQEVQQQYSAMTTAQQAEVAERVRLGQDLTRAISDVQSVVTGEVEGVKTELTGQIGGLRQEVQEQYDTLSERQQAEVAERVRMGEDLTKAISDVQSVVTGEVEGVKTELTGQIGGLRQEVREQYEMLSDVQQQEVRNRISQGEEMEAAINSVAAGIGERLTSVEDRLNSRIEELVNQGSSFQAATNQALQEVTGSIGALGLDVESQIDEFRRQQDAADAAAAETLRLRDQQQQRDTEAAVARAVQQSAEEAAARDAARAAASAEQSRRSTLAGLATSFMGQGASSSGVSDPYKATFLKPFIVGGAAPQTFEGPLAGFLKQAMTGDFLPDKPEQSAPDKEDQTMTADQYSGGGQYASNPLDMYQPEQDYAGLYGFRQGGMVPAMAMGGTRYGQNAHGGLSVLEHSGKRRLDYRQGDAVTGMGDGQSDDIPAMLADGEFVIPADVVAALGNGSTKAGSDKLYEMMHNIRRHHRSAGPKDLPPPAKAPLEYIKSRKGRSA